MTGLEREIKLEFDDHVSLPDLADVAAVLGGSVSILEERLLDAEYYDTADLRLTRWGASLRYRSDEGWMVKLPEPTGNEDSEVVARTEVRFASDSKSPPAQASALVAPFARGEALRPVARIHTARHPVRIDDPQGRPVAELVEDHVRVELPDQPPWHFRMVEIELAEGRRARDVSPIIDYYQRAGARSVSRSKLARALGTAAEADPDVVIPPVSSSPTAREVIHAAIAGSIQSHLLNLPIARVGEGSEGVHQARVALRRLRSDLRTFGPLLEPTWATELSEEVRWLGGRLGEVRDADVRIMVLNQLVEGEPSIEMEQARALLDELKVQRDVAHANLLEALDSPRCTELFDHLVDAAQDPRTAPQADDPATENIPALVNRPWRKLRKAVGRIGPEPSYSDFHRIRIKTKRCRYAAEAVEPVMGKPARRLTKAMKRIQNSLGDLNDANVIRAHLTTTANQHEELGFMAGELSGLLVARAAHCEAEFLDLWETTKGIELPGEGTG